MQRDKLADTCIGCGSCTGACEFLNKYEMNVKTFEDEGQELAFNCFLCGECNRGCPMNIDGRDVAISARQESVITGNFDARSYFSTIIEKKDYLFKNYSLSKKSTVLFTGCNFPAFYPETTQKLIRELVATADIGVIFDCCGKPIYELGLTKESDKIVMAIDKKLSENGVKEIVTLCPNCYYFLKDRLKVKIIDIYGKLSELGLAEAIAVPVMNIFTPCPDREEGLIRKSLAPFISDSVVSDIRDVQCCGLGGHGSHKEPELAKGFVEKLKAKGLKNIYTYCATCCGNFSRNGMEDARHILCEIMETHETPAKGCNSLLNRARFKFYR